MCVTLRTSVHISLLYIRYTPHKDNKHPGCRYRLQIQVHLMNFVIGLYINFTVLFRFWNNIIIIHDNVNRSLSPHIFLFMYPTPA